MIPVLYYLAALGALFSLTGLLPVLVAFGHEEYAVGVRLLVYVSLGVFISVATLLATAGREHHLGRLSGLYLVLIGWLAVPLLAAMPLVDLMELSFVDALFAAVSAFTTTGASAFGQVDAVPRGLLLFLAQLQWMGGLAILLTVSVVLAPAGIGGLREGFGTVLGASLLTSTTRLYRFCRQVTQVYLALTGFCYAALMLCSIPPYQAYILTMTAVSTGGLLPTDEALDQIAGPGGMLVMSVFLIIGSTSIFWHRMLAYRQVENLRRHRESYFLIAIWAVLAIAVAARIVQAAGLSGLGDQLAALIEGVFNAASIVSTSGMQSRPGIFALMPPVLILALVALGGGCYSTSGGIKFYRLGGMLSQSLHELNRLIYPSGVRPHHFGSQQYDIQLMKAMWSFFTAALAAILIGATALAWLGFDYQAGLTAAVAAFATAGPAYGPEWSEPGAVGWPAYFEMGAGPKLVLVAMMIAGRLELIAVLAVFNLSYWRAR